MNSQLCPVCQCIWGSEDCTHIDGKGKPGDPFLVSPTFDPDEANLLECGPAGMAAFMPPWLADPPACHVYHTITQTIPFDTWQTLFFNEERYDTDSMHDTLQNTSRITFKTSGIYLVTLNIVWNKQETDRGDQACAIWRNGAEGIAMDSVHIADPDLYGSHSLSTQEYFEAGDYVEALVKQDGELDDEGLANRIIVTRGSPVFCAMLESPAP